MHHAQLQPRALDDLREIPRYPAHGCVRLPAVVDAAEGVRATLDRPARAPLQVWANGCGDGGEPSLPRSRDLPAQGVLRPHKAGPENVEDARLPRRRNRAVEVPNDARGNPAGGQRLPAFRGTRGHPDRNGQKHGALQSVLQNPLHLRRKRGNHGGPRDQASAARVVAGRPDEGEAVGVDAVAVRMQLRAPASRLCSCVARRVRGISQL
mmetsp:Transcript_26609/g.67050  ORF Transcript_26609/g.67050 Transcript_26609/m.67050 type:complete len:209 (+) Transcript_26609:1769-2395(+)